MALIVLGAGATRGAKFVEEPIGERPVCLPPLDTDFFTQLQRLSKPALQSTVDDAIADAVELFGVNFRATLESMFSTVESMQRVAELAKQRSAMQTTADRLERARTNLLQALAAVLEESLTIGKAGATGHQHRECDYHSALVKRLRASDAIVSFNYDCLMDTSLRTHGQKIWNARLGYGLRLPPGRKQSIGEDAWNPIGAKVLVEKSIRYLKLHGSLHFSRKARGRIALKERPYTRLGRDRKLRFEIIPPESNKRFEDAPFRDLWAAAVGEVHTATTVVVIGYSFPSGDVHAQALIRAALTSPKKVPLKNVVLVNPDPAARRRALAVLERGMNKSTRVLVFDRFKEFSNVPRELWDR